MSWDHDDGFFDEGFDNTPEGFSDFQDEWGRSDAFWNEPGDAGGPVAAESEDLTDEPEISDADLAAQAEFYQTNEEYLEASGQLLAEEDERTSELEGLESAWDMDTAIGSDELELPEDVAADRMDDEDEHRHDTGPGTR
jgi:hypothetical protein